MQPGPFFTPWAQMVFNSFARECVPRIVKEIPPWLQRSGLPWSTVEEQISYAYEIYLLASRNRLKSLILGPGKLYTDPSLTANFGTTNVKLISAASHTPGKLRGTGSILADKYWTPFHNDAYILGGVHGGSPFYTTQPSAEIPLKLLWDPRWTRPSVFGRELIQLDLCGYGMADLKYAHLVGVTLGPSQWSRRANVGFKDLYRILDQIKKEDDLLEVLKSLRKRQILD